MTRTPSAVFRESTAEDAPLVHKLEWRLSVLPRELEAGLDPDPAILYLGFASRVHRGIRGA
jgi:hypothetical protein